MTGKSVKVWFPIYVGDFFVQTSTMDGHEVGAYILILAQLWRNDGAIKADDRQLAKLVRANAKQWAAIKETLWPLFEIKAGLLTHPDITAEIAKAKALVEKKRAAANKRWENKSDTPAMQVHSESNADGMPRACEGEGEGPNQSRNLGKTDSEKPFRLVKSGGDA